MAALSASELEQLSASIRNDDVESVGHFFTVHPKRINSFLCGKDKYATALLFAVQHRAKAVTLALLARGADPTKRMKGGRRSSCLDYLFNISFDSELTVALLQAGADPCLKNAGKLPPIRMAVLMAANQSTQGVGRTILETVISNCTPNLMPNTKSEAQAWAKRVSAPDWISELFDAVPGV